MTWMPALGLGRRGHPCGLNWGLLITFDCGIKRLYSSLCLNESVRSENCYFCSSFLLFLPVPPQAAMCSWLGVCRLCSGSGFRMLCCPISLHQPGSIPPLWWAQGQQGQSHPLPRDRMRIVQDEDCAGGVSVIDSTTSHQSETTTHRRDAFCHGRETTSTERLWNGIKLD